MGKVIKTVCMDCNGAGEDFGIPCTACNGTGEHELEEELQYVEWENPHEHIKLSEKIAAECCETSGHSDQYDSYFAGALKSTVKQVSKNTNYWKKRYYKARLLCIDIMKELEEDDDDWRIQAIFERYYDRLENI